MPYKSNAHIKIAAEIGLNHNGDFSTAKEMICAAKECGADYVKFQIFRTEEMYSRFCPGFEHTDSDILNQMKSYEIAEERMADLFDLCKKEGIGYGASIFDDYSVYALRNIKLDFVKIASSEINNLPLIERQLDLSPWFVVSTGMAYMHEIAETVSFFRGKKAHKLTLLECTSVYPSGPEQVFLGNINLLANTFDCESGFSDHTEGIETSIAAAALGASFIEKHFTLDKSMSGPDHKLSADPDEFRSLVKSVRNIEKSLKTNYKQTLIKEESASRDNARKSMVAACDINENEVIEMKHIKFKRAGAGISPLRTDTVLKRAANKSIRKDQLISYEDLC